MAGTIKIYNIFTQACLSSEFTPQLTIFELGPKNGFFLGRLIS